MATTTYTLEEVSKHDGEEYKQIWIIYRDSVYNVTDYLDEHPGGEDLILEHAGKDATKFFDEFGHSSDAKKLLKKHKIGELAEEDKRKKQAKQNIVEESVDKEDRRSFCSYLTCGLCG